MVGQEKRVLAVVDAPVGRVGKAGDEFNGRVLVMSSVRGSSSSSSVHAESVRAGCAPAAILLGEPDLILAVGAAVAEELYGVRVPVLQLDPDDVASIPDGASATVHEDGEVTLH